MTRWQLARNARRVASVAIMTIVYIFLFAPLVVVVGASFDGRKQGFLNFPPEELSLAAYSSIGGRLYETLGTSLMLAAVSAGISVILGVLAALGLVRSQMIGKEIVAALFRAPLQIPHVVTGVAFLQTYYLAGNLFDFNPSGSFLGLVVAHVFLVTPYVVGTVVAILHRFNPTLEEAALSLGATRWSTLRRVTLPTIMPGIYSGALFAFIVSFGDVPVSLFLASPDTMTFPVELFYSMEYDFKPAVLAISTLILIGSFVLLVMLQRAIGLQALLRAGGSS